MAIESTLHSSIGTYNFDASKLSPVDLEKLSAATGPDGQVAPDVLIGILGEYPTTFKLVGRANGLPPHHGPYEKPHYPDITDHLAAMLLAVEQKGVESLSDTRKALNDSAIAEAQQYMASKTKERDKGLAAAQTKLTADVTAASTQLASSTLQGGMALGSGLKVAQAAAATQRMKVGQDGLNAQKGHQARNQRELQQLHRELDDVPDLPGGGGIRQNQILENIGNKRTALENNALQISHKQGEVDVARQQSSQHVEESRFITAATNAMGGTISGGGSTAAAGSNFDSAVITAESKMDDANAQNHATNRDLFNGGVQDILRVIGELLSAQNQTAQSGIDASKTMARNMA